MLVKVLARSFFVIWQAPNNIAYLKTENYRDSRFVIFFPRLHLFLQIMVWGYNPELQFYSFELFFDNPICRIKQKMSHSENSKWLKYVYYVI